MNIQIYSCTQNPTNMCTDAYTCLKIFECLNLFKYLLTKSSNSWTNECLNIIVPLKSNEHFSKWTYSSKNIWMFKYSQIFVTHWSSSLALAFWLSWHSGSLDDLAQLDLWFSWLPGSIDFWLSWVSGSLCYLALQALWRSWLSCFQCSLTFLHFGLYGFQALLDLWLSGISGSHSSMAFWLS